VTKKQYNSIRSRTKQVQKRLDDSKRWLARGSPRVAAIVLGSALWALADAEHLYGDPPLRPVV
jgi:hypothetical protein